MGGQDHLDPRERPVEGARVYVSPSTGNISFVRTGADGRFAIQAAFEAEEYRVLAATEDGSLCRAERVPQGAEQEVTVVLERPMTLHGTLLDPEDRPCPDVQVVVRGSWGQVRWGEPVALRTYALGETDVLGRWRLDRLVPGLTYTVTAYDAMTGATLRRELGPFQPGERGPFTLRLQPVRD